MSKTAQYDYHRITFTHKGQRYSCYGKTLEEAIEKKLLKIKAIDNGEVGLNKNMTVERWAYTWLETYKKGNVTNKVYKDYVSKLERMILPEIGHFKLIDVKNIHLQQILNDRQGYSLDDTQKLRNFLKALFKQARISRLLTFDPAEGLIMPKTTKSSYRTITAQERKAILQLCKTHKAGMWIKTMLYCGLRPGETYALEWRDIDFEKQRINVSRAKESGSNIIKEPKSASGIRSIPIPDSLFEEFKQSKGKPFAPVFTQQTTIKRHTNTSGRSLWKNFTRELDISLGATVYRNQIIESKLAPDLVPYCLRHTFCTDLQDHGVPINVAKYLMGHADIQTTANIYTNTTEQVIDDVAKKINQK